MNLKLAATVIALVPVVLVMAWPLILAFLLAPRLADAMARPLDDAVERARRRPWPARAAGRR